MAEPTHPETVKEAPKSRMVLRDLDTDHPEEYDAWRHATKAELASFGPDPARALGYVEALDKPDLYPSEALMEVISARQELKVIDVRMYAAILRVSKGPCSGRPRGGSAHRYPLGLAAWR